MEEKKFFSRKDPRISLEIRLSIITDHREQKKTFQVSTKDISREGLLIDTQELLPENTELELIFSFPENPDSVKARGVVAWQKTNPGNGHNEAGIRIVKMDSKSLELMNSFFDSEIYYGWFY